MYKSRTLESTCLFIAFHTTHLHNGISRDILVCQQRLRLIRLLLLILGGFGDGSGTWIDIPLALSMFHVHTTWHPISLEKEILDPPPKQVLMITHNFKSDIFRLIKSNEESYLEMVSLCHWWVLLLERSLRYKNIPKEFGKIALRLTRHGARSPCKLSRRPVNSLAEACAAQVYPAHNVSILPSCSAAVNSQTSLLFVSNHICATAWTPFNFSNHIWPISVSQSLPLVIQLYLTYEFLRCSFYVKFDR